MTAPATPLPDRDAAYEAWIGADRVGSIAHRIGFDRGWDAARRAPPPSPASDPASDPASSIDHQQRIGAPLTFWTAVAAKAYRAEATRDDVRHEDAMRAALRAVETAMAEGRTPPPGQAALVEALQFYADRENWRGHNPLAPRVTQCALDEGSRARAALSSSPDDGRADAAGVGS